jgi:hypothetical protein
MKKHRKSKKFLEEIREVPNIARACQKVGISRNSVYRWIDEDPNFRDEMYKALNLGEESMNDLARMQHAVHLQKGAPWAIKYQLDNHHRDYMKPRPKDFWDGRERKKKITGFDVIVRHAKYEPTVLRTAEEKQEFMNRQRNFNKPDDDLSPKKE